MKKVETIFVVSSKFYMDGKAYRGEKTKAKRDYISAREEVEKRQESHVPGYDESRIKNIKCNEVKYQNEEFYSLEIDGIKYVESIEKVQLM